MEDNCESNCICTGRNSREHALYVVRKFTRNYGKKLAATVKLNATGIRLQYKHSTNKIKVTMANGDSVKSWTSSNKTNRNR